MLLTADDLVTMPDDNQWPSELARGELIKMPPACEDHRRRKVRAVDDRVSGKDILPGFAMKAAELSATS